MPSVTLATCAEVPDGDEDAPLLTAALDEAGLAWRWCAWDDPAVDWARDPVVLRSTWDYTPRRDAFLAWADAVRQLHNAATVVHWNTDKVYLRDLAGAGLPTVPTSFAAPGEDLTVPDAEEFVVKPSVGAGSRGAGRFTADRVDAARRHAATLHELGRTVLVQPYLGAVDTQGETATVFFAGRYSHAARKGPMLPPGVAHPAHGWELFVREEIVGREPSPQERTVAEDAVRYVEERFGTPLYARVDLLPGPDGPVVVELELTEPSLFLAHHDKAPARLVAALAERL